MFSIKKKKKTARHSVLNALTHRNNLQPQQQEQINSFNYCVTLFLLISTMSVIKLLSHIIFLEAQGWE